MQNMYIHVCACESVAVVTSAAVVVSPFPVVAMCHKRSTSAIVIIIIINQYKVASGW